MEKEKQTKELIKSTKIKNYIKGKKGEMESIVFLENQGYEILDINYKTKIGEIDIIAKDIDDRIIFIEVKARDTARFGYPREAVNYKKQQTIRRCAELYLRIKKLTKSHVRFDVVEVLSGKITHIKNAF